jgi:hypothetical protein
MAHSYARFHTTFLYITIYILNIESVYLKCIGFILFNSSQYKILFFELSLRFMRVLIITFFPTKLLALL